MYANPSLLQILLFSTLPHLTRADGVATIYLAPGYGKLPDCALQCYGYDPSGGISAAGGYLLANVLGCPQLPLKNDCFCSSDYQFVASTYLSSCAVAKCSKLPKPKTIAQSAFDVYHDYCEGNGYVKADGKFKPTDGKSTYTCERF